MLYKDMTPEALRDAYWAERRILATWDGMAVHVHSGRGQARVAGGVFRALRQIDIIVAVARKRGVTLTRKEG